MYKPKCLKVKNLLSYEDQSFDFRQGQATIIVGENLDDPGQKGNGSGKSGLNEAIVIAITGDCIRKVKKSEIVRRGCEYGEVELELYNAMYRCEIKIFRRIYAGNTSAEYKMWIDGVECNDSYSDSNSFAAFIFKTLGISKEDFFDFYIITKEHYTSFLSVGDTKKKEVVNRFSGASKVDAALPHVETDIAESKKKVEAIDRTIAQLQGKQQAIAEQIEKEEERCSQESIDKAKEELQASIEAENNALTESQVRLKSQTEVLSGLEFELAEDEGQDLTKEKESVKANIKEAEEGLNETEKEIVEIKKQKKEVLDLIAEQENSLAGVIECPKCTHNFTLADKDFDVERAREIISEAKELLNEFDEGIVQKTEVLKEYEELLKSFKVELKSIRDQEQAHQDKILNIKRKITNCNTEILNIEREVAKKKNAIQLLVDKKAAIAAAQTEKLDELNNSLMECLDEETELREKLQVAVDDRVEKEKWLLHFKSFKSFLANKSIKNIQDYTNLYLQAMGTDLSISIEGYRMLASKKLKEEITTSVIRGGIEQASYGTFSAGERGRIDICVIMAMQSLINLNSTTGGVDLLVLDEIMDSVDSLGLENIVGALQNIERTIMIVSQNEINALAEHTVIVRKQNKISRIICPEKFGLGSTQENQEQSLPLKKVKNQSEPSQSQQSEKKKKSTSKGLKKSSIA